MRICRPVFVLFCAFSLSCAQMSKLNKLRQMAKGHYRYLQFTSRPAVPKSMWQSHIASAHPHTQFRDARSRYTARERPRHRRVHAPLARARQDTWDTRAHTATARTRTHEGAPPQSHMQSLSCRHSNAHAAKLAQPDASPRARATRQRQNENPAKSTYSKFAFVERPCNSCGREQKSR